MLMKTVAILDFNIFEDCMIYQMWAHVMPYTDDETRVVLETDVNNPGDFINASFINVSN